MERHLLSTVCGVAMLIQFSVANFRSFREEAEFSMIATKEQQKRDRVPRITSRYRLSVNPVAAIYGPNGSGKSNFVRALWYLQDVILNPRRPGQSYPFEPFRLDPALAEQPSRFGMLFSHEDVLYDYRLTLTAEGIHAESLTQLLSKTEVELFSRQDGQTTLGESVDTPELNTLANVIRPDTPLVTGLAELRPGAAPNLEQLTVPYHWFQNLIVFSAGAQDLHRLRTFPLLDGWDELMRRIDVGVEGVRREETEWDALKLTEEQEKDLLKAVDEMSVLSVELESGKFEIRKTPVGVKAERIELLHSGTDGSVPLNWSEESDGTKGAAALFGLFKILSSPDAPWVIVIDELDRSFHTELTRSMVEGFLAACSPDTRTQLVFTTHDLMVMDPSLLRRDEIWITEKDMYGATELIALSEYRDLRKDKDLRKSYLEGRFGGTPRIGSLDFSRTSDSDT